METKKSTKEMRISTSLSNMNTLCANSDYGCILFYMKSNAVRASLEAAISIYLFEMLLIFTTIFSKEPLTSDKVVNMIFVPLIISAAACIAYTYFVTKKTNELALRIINESIKSEAKVSYNSVDETFANLLRKIHRLGAISYAGASAMSAFLLTYCFYEDYLIYKAESIIAITVLGTLFGMMWNKYGLLSDNRIDWARIFPQIIESSILEENEVRQRKYQAYRKSIQWQVFIFITILTVVSVIAITLKTYLFINQSLEVLITYSSIPALFVAILTIYLKQTYSIFFKLKRNDDKDYSVIFPNVFELTLKTEAKDETENYLDDGQQTN